MLCIRSTSHEPVSIRPSVSVSVTSRCSTKMAKRRITQIRPHDTPGTLVFWRQRYPRNSTVSHIHLTILISARWSATMFSFLTGQVPLPCNMLLRTQLLYNLPLIISETSLLVSSGTNCLNLFQPIRIRASTAASASPSTLNMSPR